MSLEATDDASVCDHEQIGAGIGGDEARDGEMDASDQVVVELEPGRAAGGVEEPRPAGLDLGPSEAGPFADVAFDQIVVQRDGSDARRRGNGLCGVACPFEGRRHDGVDDADASCGRERLVAAELRQGWVGSTLPPTLLVPGRLRVADEQHASHGADRSGRV